MEIGNKIMKLNWNVRIMSAILNGLLFVGIMCLIDYLLDKEFQSLNSYLFQGMFFGFSMGIVYPFLMQKFGPKFNSKIGKNIKPELTQDESIEIEGPANLFRGMEGVGGKLYLTNKKVVFKAHKINIQKGQTDILYENITEIIKRKTAKIINNGIRIKTNDKNEFDFVVNDREKWIEKLNERITK